MTDNTHIESLEQLETQLNTSLNEVREQLNQSRVERDLVKWNGLVPEALLNLLDEQPSQELVLEVNNNGAYLWFRIPFAIQDVNALIPAQPEWMAEVQSLQVYNSVVFPRVTLCQEAIFDAGRNHTGYQWFVQVEGPTTLLASVLDKMPPFKLSDNFDRTLDQRKEYLDNQIKEMEKQLEEVEFTRELGHKLQVTKKEERECPF